MFLCRCLLLCSHEDVAYRYSSYVSLQLCILGLRIAYSGYVYCSYVYSTYVYSPATYTRATYTGATYTAATYILHLLYTLQLHIRRLRKLHLRNLTTYYVYSTDFMLPSEIYGLKLSCRIM